MNSRSCFLVHVGSALLPGMVAALALCWQQAAAKPATAAEDPQERYRTQVLPFLQKHCISCHGGEKPKGDLRLDTLKADVTSLKSWAEIRARLLAGEMPPRGKPQPTRAELQPVLECLTDGLIRNAAPVLVPPTEGNRVDHDLLFGAQAGKLPASTPARDWRISSHIYFRFLQDLDPEVSSSQLKGSALKRRFVVRYSQPFSVPATGFSDYSGTFTIDQPTAEVLIRNAKELAKSQTEWRVDKDGKPVMDQRTKLLAPRYSQGIPKEFLALMDTSVPPTRPAMESAIRMQFKLVVLRQPNDEELTRFVTLMERNVQDAGQVEGVRGTLAALLLLREVIFRSEAGQGPEDEHGRRMLGPRELAYAIAYALTDQRPDAELLAAAQKGRLATRDDVRSHVERILNDRHIDKPRILRFFQEYFDYPEAIKAFKDQRTTATYGRSLNLKRDTYFNYRPESLVLDTDMLVEYILEQDKHVFEELLTTNKAFIHLDPKTGKERSTNHNERYQEYFYNLDEWPAQQPVSLSAEQRAGILTQPSWLIHHSFNERTDPIHRGKWIRERLLGTAMAAVPPSVDATIPDDPEKTVRERLAGTQKAYCWNCHQKMNPLGLSLEMFDAFGRVRQEELGRPVDSTGSIDFSGDEKLDGPIANGVELLKKLARSPRVRQVFVRHAFRYWLGRAETLHDASTLIASERAYVESGGSMKALITALLTSDSFLYRSGQLRQP